MSLCHRSMLCALVRGHGGACDPRDEHTRAASVLRLSRRLDGDALFAACERASRRAMARARRVEASRGQMLTALRTALVARVLGLHVERVRVVMCVSGLVGDVLLDGRSALPETLSRLARAGLPLATWDPSPGRLGTATRVRGRLTRVPERYRAPRVAVVGDAATAAGGAS